MKLSSLCLMLCLSLGLLAACASTSEPTPELLPPASSRQAQLSSLYDRLGADNESTGKAAATEAAKGTDRDLRFMASLWGSRQRSALGARRFGDALSERASQFRDGTSAVAYHQYAYDWYERAYLELSNDDPALDWARYEMARELVSMKRGKEAITLLGNRYGTIPLPKDLAEKCNNLIREAEKLGS